MEVGRLPLSASQRGKLISAGYTTLASLSSLSPSHLARDLRIPESEAFEILRVASLGCRLEQPDKHTAIVSGGQTAWEILNEEKLFPRITTSCADLDNILGGGINCKEVTEIGGVPGIGKTQLGIQLAVNVQIPADYGGLDGKAVYIDTEGSFMVERALQIAEASVVDMSQYNELLRKESRACRVEIQPTDILEKIYYFRICSYTEQIALINYLDKFISENKDVKIVIIDSVTFHFRQDFEDLALRTRLLGGMALKLMNLGKKYNVAVVIFNQVTTKCTDGSFQLSLALGKFCSRLSPIFNPQFAWSISYFLYHLASLRDFVSCYFLGDSWSHSCTNRVILYWNGDERNAYIDKSPSLRSASASFSVTSKGIRNSASNHKRIKLM